jgi:hypothetical protein
MYIFVMKKSLLFGLALVGLANADYSNLYAPNSVTYKSGNDSCIVKAEDIDGRFNLAGVYEHHALLNIDGVLYNNTVKDTAIAKNGLHYRIVNGDKFYTGIYMDTINSADKKSVPKNILLQDNKGIDTIIGNTIIRFDTILDAEKQVKMWIDNNQVTMNKDSAYNINNTNYRPTLLWGWEKNNTRLPQRYFLRLDVDTIKESEKNTFLVPITGQKMIKFDNDSCLVSVLSQPDAITYMKIAFGKDTVLGCINGQIYKKGNFYGVLDTIRENGGNKYLQLKGILMCRDGTRNYLNLNEGWKVGFNKDSSLIKFNSYDSGKMSFQDDMFYPKGVVDGKVGDTITTKDGLKVFLEDSYIVKGKRLVLLKAISIDRGITKISNVIKPAVLNKTENSNMYDLRGRLISKNFNVPHSVLISKNKKLINLRIH